MIPKQAIEKAIEGGWKNSEYEWATSHVQDAVVVELAARLIALDRTFWQALGKALGWNEANGKVGAYHSFVDGKIVDEYWMLTAHRFYDLILTGGDTETYWDELLHGR